MSSFEIWLLAVGLAMDCFTVSVASGIIQRCWRGGTAASLSVAFGVFQGGMTLIGWVGTRYLHGMIESVDHWIAFGLLAFLGSRMIYEGLQSDEKSHHFNPAEPKVVLTLAVATSIDALAVGISFACLGMHSRDMVSPVLIIALVSTLFSLVGYTLGIACGRRIHLPVEPVGGLILIAIGCRILYEHLAI